MSVLGIDIGGTTIKTGFVSGYRVKDKVEIPAPKSREDIVRALKNIIAFAHADRIGIGCPGIIDGTKVTYCPNLPLSGFDFKTLGNVVANNDAACAAWAEAQARKSKNLICLTLGTGVGSGIVIDGKLHPAEAGHMTIDYKGKKSKCCGNDGCRGNDREWICLDDADEVFLPAPRHLLDVAVLKYASRIGILQRVPLPAIFHMALRNPGKLLCVSFL